MILLIDNYDSFTFNLLDYLKRLQTPSGALRQVTVRKNDSIDCSEIVQMQPEAIVISPGPGIPENAGVTIDVIAQFHQEIPILGICLGHQAIGQYFGAKLVETQQPVHGKTSVLIFNGTTGNNDPVFAGMNSPVEVMRYHSLQLEGLEQTSLQILAKSEDGSVMALRHPDFPLYGLQFHPESICSPMGFKMIENWAAQMLQSPCGSTPKKRLNLSALACNDSTGNDNIHGKI